MAYVNEFVSHARRHDDHLSAHGTSDPVKLIDRCIAQQKIYQHACSYMDLEGRATEISSADWMFYSKAVFLLARQCAAANLPEHALQMIKLSETANGGRNKKHRLFRFLAITLGWRNASKLIDLAGK